MDWKRGPKADPTDWLLESENPSVRYWALTDLLDRPADDLQVRAARAAILTWLPAAALLAAQRPTGYWVGRDYYIPKHYSTFWVLSVLADLGLTAEDEHVRRGCEFVFTHQRQNGAFCRRRHIPGRGMVWEAGNDACTHARIVRLLIQFGHGRDPRTRKAMDWLLETQRDDGMWLCGRAGPHGCLRATLDVLRAAVLDPETAAHPAITRAAAIVCDLLMEPRMGHYHVDDEWTRLVYPYFGYGVIPALDALARLGYTPEHPKIAAAMEYLWSRQLPDGTWPLDQGVFRPPLDFGEPGQPNKWLTLDALCVIRRMGESANGRMNVSTNMRMYEWKDVLKADPTGWLLEPGNPSVRYWTLVDILGRPADDLEVQEARAAIARLPLVQELFARQHPDGHWGDDATKPHTAEGTLGVLSVLHTLGVEPGRRTAAGCDSFVRFCQHGSGGFSMVGTRRSGIFPCTTGPHLPFLVYFGLGDDPRVRRAFVFLVEPMSADGALDCGRYGHRDCLWGAIAALNGLAVLPADMRSSRSEAVVRRLADALLDADYDFAGEHKRWLTFGVPRAWDLLSALRALAVHGYTHDPRFAPLLDLVLSRQDEQGRWRCGSVSRTWPLEQRNRPSKWVTLDALRLLKSGTQ